MCQIAVGYTGTEYVLVKVHGSPCQPYRSYSNMSSCPGEMNESHVIHDTVLNLNLGAGSSSGKAQIIHHTQPQATI